jgi:hypothetical protein
MDRVGGFQGSSERCTLRAEALCSLGTTVHEDKPTLRRLPSAPDTRSIAEQRPRYEAVRDWAKADV